MEDLIKQLHDKGEIAFQGQGHSMQPMLMYNKNIVVVERIDRPLKKYDVVLFENNGNYILHRIVKIKDNLYTMCGDCSIRYEKDIDEKQIVGILKKFIRNVDIDRDRWIDVDDLSYKIYSRIVVLLKPVRNIVLKLYTKYVGEKGNT